MKSRLLKTFIGLTLSFTFCLFMFSSAVSAQERKTTYSIEDGSGGTGSAYISSGKATYSSTSNSNAYFTIKSKTTTTSYLLINISITNGSLYDNITGKKVLDSSVGSTNSSVIRKNGVEFHGKFVPKNSNVNGYNIQSYSAYN